MFAVILTSLFAAFDPATGDYEWIDYVVSFMFGIPIAIILIASGVNAMTDAIRAPFVRVLGKRDVTYNPFESYSSRGDHSDS